MGTIRGTTQRDLGFTLIELLVVIVILGVLAAIAIPAFLQHRTKGWDAAVRSDLRSAATAQETFLSDGTGGPYATDVEQLKAAGFRPSPATNYAAGNSMSVTANSSYNYCFTAQSASGKYFALGSDTGWLTSANPIDPATCQ